MVRASDSEEWLRLLHAWPANMYCLLWALFTLFLASNSVCMPTASDDIYPTDYNHTVNSTYPLNDFRPTCFLPYGRREVTFGSCIRAIDYFHNGFLPDVVLWLLNRAATKRTEGNSGLLKCPWRYQFGDCQIKLDYHVALPATDAWVNRNIATRAGQALVQQCARSIPGADKWGGAVTFPSLEGHSVTITMGEAIFTDHETETNIQ